MKLCRLIYLSDATTAITTGELTRIVQTASDANQSRGITGILLYSGGHFMQALEGDPIRLATLYTKIAADARHTNVRQILHREIDARLFPDWGMQLLNADTSLTLDRERIDKILLRLRLKAAHSDASEATLLLEEFRAQFLEKKIPA